MESVAVSILGSLSARKLMAFRYRELLLQRQKAEASSLLLIAALSLVVTQYN